MKPETLLATVGFFFIGIWAGYYNRWYSWLLLISIWIAYVYVINTPS